MPDWRHGFSDVAIPARQPRVHFSGAPYPVMCRGNQGQTIFTDDQNRRRYVELPRESQRRFGRMRYAYVLLGNHIHHLPSYNISGSRIVLGGKAS